MTRLSSNAELRSGKDKRLEFGEVFQGQLTQIEWAQPTVRAIVLWQPIIWRRSWHHGAVTSIVGGLGMPLWLKLDVVALRNIRNGRPSQAAALGLRHPRS